MNYWYRIEVRLQKPWWWDAAFPGELDRVLLAFPGDGAAVPSEAERIAADALVGRQIPRRHTENGVFVFAGWPTNRAYLRSAVRRHILRETSCP